MQDFLKLDNIVVSYGAITALKDVSITVPKGQIIALLGANGAGKSTLLKTISGLTNSSSGTISFMNEEITEMSAEKIVKKGIIHSPEGRQIFANLTTEENLIIGSFSLKDRTLIKENLKTVYNYFPILKDRNKQIAGTLSGGEQQMLAIARALMANPKLLILDEPSLGLAPLIVKDIFDIIKELNKNGTTILIVEQNAKQTLKIVDYAYVLEVGKIKYQGSAKELLNDPKIIDAYLGGH